MVRFLSRLVQDGVGLHHVIHHVALGDLLGAELLRSGQVFPIVVAEVIVADNGFRLSRGGEELIKMYLFRKYSVVQVSSCQLELSPRVRPLCLTHYVYPKKEPRL